MQAPRETEISENFKFFQTIVDRYLPAEAGRYALLHDRKVIALFDSAGQAARAGHQQFPNDLFSVQQVARAPLDLGFYSHVGGQGEGR